MICPYCYGTAQIEKTRSVDSDLGEDTVVAVEWHCESNSFHVWHDYVG